MEPISKNVSQLTVFYVKYDIPEYTFFNYRIIIWQQLKKVSNSYTAQVPFLHIF